MASKRAVAIRDRQRNSPSRKKTYKEREQRMQQLAATLRRLEDADKQSQENT